MVRPVGRGPQRRHYLEGEVPGRDQRLARRLLAQRAASCDALSSRVTDRIDDQLGVDDHWAGGSMN
jgi:hypothetical protein